MVKSKGATPGAILSTTPGATPRQRPVNGGATHTPYTPSVAPALGGWVHATNGGRGYALALYSPFDRMVLTLEQIKERELIMRRWICRKVLGT